MASALLLTSCSGGADQVAADPFDAVRDAIPSVAAEFADTPYAKLPVVPTFEVVSDDVVSGSALAEAQTGGSVSPQISWTGVPAGARSFAVTMYDQDAPTGSGFWHWVSYDIPVDVRNIEAGMGSDPSHVGVPGVIQALNDAGTPGYMGAAPPAGRTHRYFITVTALDVDKLDVPRDASPALVGFSVGAHALSRGFLVGTATGT